MFRIYRPGSLGPGLLPSRSTHSRWRTPTLGILCALLAAPGLNAAPPDAPQHSQKLAPDFAALRTLWLARAPALASANARQNHALSQVENSRWLSDSPRLQLSALESAQGAQEQELMLSLPLPAGLTARLGQAQAERRAAALNIHATEIEQSAVLYRLLAQARSAQAEVRLWQQQQQAMADWLTNAGARLQAGEISRAEYLSVSLDKTATDSALALTLAQAANLERNWRTRLGEDAPASSAVELPMVTWVAPTTAPTALQQRQAELAANQAGLTLAANRWTELELGWIYRREHNPQTAELDQSQSTYYGLQLSLPLGRSRVQREAESAAALNVRNGQIELAQSSRELAQDQAEAAAERRLRQDLREQQQGAAVQARELADLRQRALAAGEADWARTREQLQQTFAVQLAAIAAERQYHEAIVQWALAYGVLL